jgi:hypothetical protein
LGKSGGISGSGEYFPIVVRNAQYLFSITNVLHIYLMWTFPSSLFSVTLGKSGGISGSGEYFPIVVRNAQYFSDFEYIIFTSCGPFPVLLSLWHWESLVEYLGVGSISQLMSVMSSTY